MALSSTDLLAYEQLKSILQRDKPEKKKGQKEQLKRHLSHRKLKGSQSAATIGTFQPDPRLVSSTKLGRQQSTRRPSSSHLHQTHMGRHRP